MASCRKLAMKTMARAPVNPAHPQRVCWGCGKYCPADDLACGNGTVRTMHPCELFGDDWLEWSSKPRQTEQGDDGDGHNAGGRECAENDARVTGS